MLIVHVLSFSGRMLNRLQLDERHVRRRHTSVLEMHRAETLLADLLLTNATLLSPREQVELGLATREAHLAALHLVEKLVVEQQIVEFGFC